ncbi:RNA pol II accessory factor, Cdc73 family-domain-containing protein [Haematococcus lacustris]
MDPLSLLRSYNLSNKLSEVKVEGDQVHFGTEYVFPVKTFTAFRGGDDYEALDVILHVLKTKGLSQAEYLKSTMSARVGRLPHPKRVEILSYLDGKSNLAYDAGDIGPAATQDAEPAVKKARVHGLEDETSHYERQLRDRNSMLSAPAKEFRGVLDIAHKAFMELKEVMKMRVPQKGNGASAPTPAQSGSQPTGGKPANQARPGNHSAASAAVAAPRSSNRFDRDTTTDQLKAMGGAAAANIASVLDLYGSAAQGSAPPPPPPPSSSKDSHVGHSGSSSSSKPPPSGSGVKPGHPPARQPSQGSQGSRPHSSSRAGSGAQGQRPPGLPGPPGSGGYAKQGSGSKPAPGPAAGEPAAAVDKLAGAVPIIIVPSGMTAMINMWNARQFLEEGRFQPSEALQASGAVKASSLTIQRTAHKPQGKAVVYEITDKPPAKTSPDWGRVVAVIVQGAKWQFKDWPFPGAAAGELMETFSQVAGFYVHFKDEKVPPAVASWNVKPLGFVREKRHMDMTVMLDFYKHLDAFLLSRKCSLAY